MNDFAYTRLSELDRSFLIYEGPNAPMHVGAVQIHEGATLRDAGGAIDFERVLDYVGSRLHRIPRYRQRIEAAPIGGHPIWVDDGRFDLQYHVRHTRLPRPGSERILKRSCARILEQRLDPHKPLWELWLIEGLERDRVAIVSKVHHCMVDGVAGADLMSVLMTPEPTAKIETPPRWIPRPGPTAFDYAVREAQERARAPLSLARELGKWVANEDGARDEWSDRLGAVGHLVGSILSPVASTPFNQPIGPHRRFDWLTMPLDDLKFIGHRLGGSVNDVALAIAAGAIRRFLKHVRLTDPDEIDFRVLAPVSLREAREDGRFGNRVSAWFVALPVAERDPRRRLSKICEETARLRKRHEALGVEVLTQIIEWTGALPLLLGARLFEKAQPPFHLVVTNVPGPRGVLYFLEAPMLEAHPMVPLFGNLSLGIALFSVHGTISWGICADRALFPDLHEFVRALGHSFEGLMAHARRAGEPAAPGELAERKHRSPAGEANAGRPRKRRPRRRGAGEE